METCVKTADDETSLYTPPPLVEELLAVITTSTIAGEDVLQYMPPP
jgi:hypothetical protein